MSCPRNCPVGLDKLVHIESNGYCCVFGYIKYMCSDVAMVI